MAGDFLMSLKPDPLRGVAIKVFPLMREGYDRTEIATRVGESKVTVGRACAYIRSGLTEWVGL